MAAQLITIKQRRDNALKKLSRGGGAAWTTNHLSTTTSGCGGLGAKGGDTNNSGADNQTPPTIAPNKTKGPALVAAAAATPAFTNKNFEARRKQLKVRSLELQIQRGLWNQRLLVLQEKKQKWKRNFSKLKANKENRPLLLPKSSAAATTILSGLSNSRSAVEGTNKNIPSSSPSLAARRKLLNQRSMALKAQRELFDQRLVELTARKEEWKHGFMEQKQQLQAKKEATDHCTTTTTTPTDNSTMCQPSSPSSNGMKPTEKKKKKNTVIMSDLSFSLLSPEAAATMSNIIKRQEVIISQEEVWTPLFEDIPPEDVNEIPDDDVANAFNTETQLQQLGLTLKTVEMHTELFDLKEDLEKAKTDMSDMRQRFQDDFDELLMDVEQIRKKLDVGEEYKPPPQVEKEEDELHQDNKVEEEEERYRKTWTYSTSEDEGDEEERNPETMRYPSDECLPELRDSCAVDDTNMVEQVVATPIEAQAETMLVSFDELAKELEKELETLGTKEDPLERKEELPEGLPIEVSCLPKSETDAEDSQKTLDISTEIKEVLGCPSWELDSTSAGQKTLTKQKVIELYKRIKACQKECKEQGNDEVRAAGAKRRRT